MTPTEIAWWLRRLPGLADAADAPLKELAQHWEPLVVAGRTFLVEGQPSDGLYMLVEGQVEVVRGGPDGNPVMVGMVKQLSDQDLHVVAQYLGELSGDLTTVQLSRFR